MSWFGTVGAAMQGYMRGYPTIAISVGSIQNPQFGPAAALLPLIGKRLIDNSTNGQCLLNINIPRSP
ncbi:MAG: hypothetical protein CM1200mP15_13580 [Dehalococcoidia bacterium]|nr:MAG: hypothetical protein CM1200mP15_13580 [Dehalococcoidia bacterium]